MPSLPLIAHRISPLHIAAQPRPHCEPIHDVPASLCKLAGVVTKLQGLTAKRALHEKRASAGYVAEMGLDEEKTVLGEEIVSEQVKPVIYIFSL